MRPFLKSSDRSSIQSVVDQIARAITSLTEKGELSYLEPTLFAFTGTRPKSPGNRFAVWADMANDRVGVWDPAAGSWQYLYFGQTEFSELTIGGDTHYLHIDTTGTLRLYGDATTWNDLRFPAQGISKAGVRDPDFVQVFDDGAGSTGVYTYAFSAATEEELFFAAQMDHKWKEGSTIYPHIHWMPTTTGAGDVVWGLEYTWANVHGTFGNTTIVTATDSSDLIAGKHQIADLGAITDTGKTLSSMLLCRVFRDATDAADTYAADAALLEIDIHYEIDSLGSNEEYVK